MADRDSALRGLAEISEYMSNKADIAAIGKGKEVFDSWYRAAEDALALLKEQPEIVRCKDCKHWGTNDCSMHNLWGNVWGDDEPTLDEWFCPIGERR